LGTSTYVLRAQIYEAKQDLERALAEIEAAVAAFDPGHRPNRHRTYQIYLLARSGDLGGAEAVLDEVRAEVDSMDGVFQWHYEEAAGLLEWARGNLPRAASLLEAADRRLLSPSPDLAAVYLEMGQLGEAVAQFEEVNSDYMFRVEFSVGYIKAVYDLGVAYEQSGWTNKAIAQYEAFLEKWKDADPGIPEIEDARQRLARLRG
jgi:tetratricopeptide (TPR) repeat protein